jgi:hypothetical protein
MGLGESTVGDEGPRHQAAISAHGFWILWATVTVGLAAVYESRIPYLIPGWTAYWIGQAFVVAAFVVFVALGMWASSGRITLVPILFALAGALLAPIVFEFVLNLTPAAVWNLPSAPGRLEIIVNWPDYALYGPFLVALAVGATVAAVRRGGPSSVRDWVRVALCILGALYAVGVLFLWFRVGFAPYGPTEASRSYAEEVYWWAEGYPILGLGAAAAMSLWTGILQPWLSRHLPQQAHRTSAST